MLNRNSFDSQRENYSYIMSLGSFVYCEKKGYLNMKLNRLYVAALLIVFLMIVFSGCKKEEIISGLKEADITVYTTIYPIEYIVNEIGGTSVAVHSIYPPGVDAHTFEPTSQDMTNIAVSDAFIYFGPSLEGFVSSTEKALASESVELIALESYPELFYTEGRDEDIANGNARMDEINPHVWIDPLRMITMADIITEHLSELNPAEAETYNENKQSLVLQLQKLDEQFKSTLAKKDHKYMIVPHAAYSYWEERYGVEEIALSGLSPSEEPSQKYLTEIIRLADEYEVKHVFYEQNTPDKLIEIIEQEIDAEAVLIHNLAVLTEDDIKFEEDYFTIMQYNLDVLNYVFE